MFLGGKSPRNQEDGRPFRDEKCSNETLREVDH